MKVSTILLVILLFLLVTPSNAAIIVNEVARSLLFLNSMFNNDTQRSTTPDFFVKIDNLLQENELIFENKMKELKSHANMHLFQQQVGLGVERLKSLRQAYSNNQNESSLHEMIMSECLSEMPYKRLINLNTLVTDNLFLKDAELNNYQFDKVEAFRTQIFHAANQLGFAYFVCKELVDGQKVNKADPAVKFVISLVKNITETVEKQLQTIDRTFFPEYVERAVISKVKRLTLAGTLKENNYKIAHTLSHMLVHHYSYGYFTTSNKPILHNNAYTVFVGQKQTVGKFPKEHVILLKFKDSTSDYIYNILIYRSNVTNGTSENEHKKLVIMLDTRIFPCLDSTLGVRIDVACSGHEFCGLSDYDDNSVAVGQNNFEHSVEKICNRKRTVMSGLPQGALIVAVPNSSTYSEIDFLKYMSENSTN